MLARLLLLALLLATPARAEWLVAETEHFRLHEDTSENRIRQRDNVSEDYINKRMEYTKEWMGHADIYDYTVVNEDGKLDEAIGKVAKIIKKYL